MDIKKIDHEFITSNEFYLRSVRKCNNNSAVKYIKNHACPTKVGFKLAVILFCQWLQPKICCFNFGGSTPSLFQGENTRGGPFIFCPGLIGIFYQFQQPNIALILTPPFFLAPSNLLRPTPCKISLNNCIVLLSTIFKFLILNPFNRLSEIKL